MFKKFNVLSFYISLKIFLFSDLHKVQETQLNDGIYKASVNNQECTIKCVQWFCEIICDNKFLQIIWL